MTLKTVQEYYPVNDTYVGFFDTDGIFYFDNLKEIEDIDFWDDTPFYIANDCIGFLEYLGGNEYKSWFFAFSKVIGYFTHGDYDDFYPMIHNEDFNFEKVEVDIEDDQHIVIEPPIEEEDETYMNKIIEAFKRWHPNCGPIITSSKELENFIKSKENRVN